MIFDEDTQRVTVVNIHMPFWSMVVFMVKWSIASIPALIILFGIAALMFGLLGSFFSGLLLPSF
ncbi:MAG: hypothetical protein O7G87_21025 [bacterium]|nr:hypothetical protein [bacterium]